MKSLWITPLLLTALAGGQMPVPALPQVYIDTTWNLPVNGTTWPAHTAADLKNALKLSNPGDVIVLDAGATYTGNFTLPVKSNPQNQWIYIISSGLSALPIGTTVNPNEAGSMAKLVSPGVMAVFYVPPGANHYRLAGLEMTSASTQGCNLTHNPPINCFSYYLVGADGVMGQALPDSLTVDRCYLHGSPTQDVGQGFIANGSNMALIDSYVSDIHESLFDSQAIMAYNSPGPIKIVDNFLSATTEDIMFGGSGGPNNPWVPSDIEIRKNHLFKPLSWAAVGVTIPPNNQWVEKDNLEFKSARRVLVDSNILENTWVSGQTGTSVLFTVRTGQSGDIAVVDDITFTNNILKNVGSGFTTLAADNLCGTSSYPKCKNPGESKRIRIFNNLVLFRDPSLVGGVRNTGIQFNPGMTDYVLQHNTFVPAPNTDCWNDVYFAVKQGLKWPLTVSDTHNLWLLDNAFCRQTTGDHGGQGTTGLNSYMSDPAPLDPRYLGNVMYVPSDNNIQQWPAHNFATPLPFIYVDPYQGNYQLLVPLWLDTSDGKEAGIDNSLLPAH
jgi:hypothetical protein